jgi:CRISPR/Cas system CSM-associated protein Csm2 small subunit
MTSKKKNEQGLAQFLSDFINEPDWDDDRNDFAKLVDRFVQIHR